MPLPSPTGTTEVGTVYVATWGVYERQEITAANIRKFRRNVYGRALYTKQKNLILSQGVVIRIYDKNDDPDEKLQLEAEREFLHPDRIDLNQVADQIFSDEFFYGPYISNPIWTRKGGRLALQKLRRLPPYSFDTLPPGRQQFSRLLPGVTLNPDTEEIEFWQTTPDDPAPQLLDKKNLFWVISPGSEEIAGEPFIEPIAPVIEMLNFTWQAVMQLANRLGAPVLFIKVANPVEACEANGWIGDIEYAEMILQNWGKDNQYPLRDNMTLERFEYKDSNIALEIIDLLHWVIIDYTSPASWVAKDGTLIGGSSMPEQKLMEAYVAGICRHLEQPLTKIVQLWLEGNGYSEHRAEVEIPVSTVEDKQVQLRQAIAGFKTRSLLPDEIRELLGFEGLDEDEWNRMQEIYDKLAPAQTNIPGATSGTGLGLQLPLQEEESMEVTEKALEDELDRFVGRMYTDELFKLIEKARAKK